MANAKPQLDPVRAYLVAEVEKRQTTLAELSRQIGKNHAYLQQFIARGVPKMLPERERARLAEALGVDEVLLGRQLSDRPASASKRLSQVLDIGEYNAFASAGGGVTLGDEEKTGFWPLPRAYLEEMRLSGNGLAVVPVKGDSMEPTLRSGDRVLIDMGDHNVSQGGLFVLWDGNGRVVKRVERIPGKHPEMLLLIPDNPLHTRYPVPAEDVTIIGRVVWAARRL